MNARTYARTHARIHTHARTHAPTHSLSSFGWPMFIIFSSLRDYYSTRWHVSRIYHRLHFSGYRSYTDHYWLSSCNGGRLAFLCRRRLIHTCWRSPRKPLGNSPSPCCKLRNLRIQRMEENESNGRSQNAAWYIIRMKSIKWLRE